MQQLRSGCGHAHSGRGRQRSGCGRGYHAGGRCDGVGSLWPGRRNSDPDQTGRQAGRCHQRHRDGSQTRHGCLLRIASTGALGAARPHAAHARGRHSGFAGAWCDGRTGAGAGTLRHHVFRAGFGARYRICGRISGHRSNGRLDPRLATSAAALAHFTRLLSARRHGAPARRSLPRARPGEDPTRPGERRSQSQGRP